MIPDSTFQERIWIMYSVIDQHFIKPDIIKTLYCSVKSNSSHGCSEDRRIPQHIQMLSDWKKVRCCEGWICDKKHIPGNSSTFSAKFAIMIKPPPTVLTGTGIYHFNVRKTEMNFRMLKNLKYSPKPIKRIPVIGIQYRKELTSSNTKSTVNSIMSPLFDCSIIIIRSSE